jgi:hypothetical protein
VTFENRTPHAHHRAFLYDAEGREVMVVLVKASFRLGSSWTERAAEPLPIHLCDELFPSGGLRYPCDLILAKTGTDVIVNGAAYAPSGLAEPAVPVALRVGATHRALRVFGPRTWVRGAGGLVPGEPEPFASLPLGYEHAFGGSDGVRVFAHNPIGLGFWDPEVRDDPEGLPLPRIEDEAAPIASPEDRPAPAGLGAIPGHWPPRAGHGGTYDDRWERTRAPLAPEDFDLRFFDAASPGLTIEEGLEGGEDVELVNLAPSGRVVTALPRVGLWLLVGEAAVPLSLDRVILEPDDDRVALTYRASIDVTGQIDWLPPMEIVEGAEPPGGAL